MYAGCAGKTVRSLENTCHTWAPSRQCAIQIHVYLYLYLISRSTGTKHSNRDVNHQVGSKYICSNSNPYSLNCHWGAIVVFHKFCRTARSSTVHKAESMSATHFLSPLLDNIRVMVVVWRLRGNIIRTAPCWVVWHNVHSQQHTHVSSSYRSSRLGFRPYLKDRLVSFSALTLLVWSYDP